MYDFDIVKKNTLNNKSFRVAKLYDQFDLYGNEYSEKFSGSIDVPEEWNIGVIVGKSGTGKTTILKNVFGDYILEFKYNKKSVIDDFDSSISEKELFNTLSKVGFSSPVSWLKPYSVLSNGEKMRVDLARAILQNKDIIVFDEYTSVVDREIAKVGSLAMQKIIRKSEKKFIAITCHYDIIEWIKPDWVFSTDEMQTLPRGCLQQRPNINIEIKRVKGFWRYFSKYHYLNHSINHSAHEYVGFYNNKPICFCSVICFPHPKHGAMWKVHRIVVLPDYQGIGIGVKMLEIIAKKYKNYFGITTSLNGFAMSLIKNKSWNLIRAGRANGNQSIKGLNKTSSKNRNPYSFRYVGEFE